MEARKTEYRGVIFRSKSEAQLAYLFDHSSLGVTGWIYEPEKLRLKNGYIPDFAIFMRTDIWVIEYKPNEPTKTYSNKFYVDRMSYFNTLITNAIIIFGNCYDGKFYEHCEDLDHKRLEFFDKALVENAKNYRFDLK